MSTKKFLGATFFRGHIISPERIVMCLVGIFFVALSVGMIRFAGFGNDPYSAMMVGAWHLAKKLKPDIPLGTVFLMINMAVAITIFFVHKQFIGIGTLVNMFLLGYIADFFFEEFGVYIPDPEIPVRIVFLILGLVFEALGISFCLEADQGVSPYDGISLMIFKYHPKWKFRWLRVALDVSYVILGAVFFAISTIIGQNAFDPAQWSQFGGVVGFGSVFIALCLGPVLIVFRTRIANPLAMHRFRKAAKNRQKKEKDANTSATSEPSSRE